MAALDIRFRWLPSVPVSASIAALITMVPAVVLTYRAIAVNTFFSSHVRIQTDRGHVLVTTGPYRYIRLYLFFFIRMATSVDKSLMTSSAG